MAPELVTGGSRRTQPPSGSTSQPGPISNRKLSLSLVAALAFALTFLAARPAGATTPAQAVNQPAAPSLRILEQNTFVAADGALNLLLEVSAPTDDAVLSVVVHGRLTHEDEIDGPAGPALVRLAPVDIEALPFEGTGRRRLVVPIRSSNRFDDQERAYLKDPGVYPVTIEMRDVDGPLTSVKTQLVRLPVETSDGVLENPVPVSIVLTISTAEGLSAAEVTGLLSLHPTMPITVVLGPGAADQLRRDADTRSALVEALDGRPVLTAPTIDLDPSALAEIGQEELYVASAAADRKLVEGLGMTPAEGLGLLDAPLTDDGVALLRTLGWRAVLDFSGRSPVSVRLSSSDEFTVVRPDHDLSAILDSSPISGPDDGSYRANTVLAHLVLRGADETGTVVLGGPTLGLDPADTVAAVLQALTRPGGPRPVPLGDVVGEPVERPAERPSQDLRTVANLVAALRSRLSTYESFVGVGASASTESTDTSEAKSQTVDPRLVAALSRQRNPEDRGRALTLLDTQIRGDLDVIDVHQPQPVTVAARSAPLPVVLANEAAGPRRVLLRLRSDGLVSPDDGRIVELRPGTSSIDVTVEARSLGVSPLEVSVWTPDAATELASAEFEIRSTAVPGVGLVVSLLAVGLLAVWWYVDRFRDSIGAEPVEALG